MTSADDLAKEFAAVNEATERARRAASELRDARAELRLERESLARLLEDVKSATTVRAAELVDAQLTKVLGVRAEKEATVYVSRFIRGSGAKILSDQIVSLVKDMFTANTEACADCGSLVHVQLLEQHASWHAVVDILTESSRKAFVDLYGKDEWKLLLGPEPPS